MHCHYSHKKKIQKITKRKTSILYLVVVDLLVDKMSAFYSQCRQGPLLERLSLPKGSDFIILAWVSYCCLTPFICTTTSILTAIMSCNWPAGRSWNNLDLCIEQKLIFFFCVSFPYPILCRQNCTLVHQLITLHGCCTKHKVSPAILAVFCF